MELAAVAIFPSRTKAGPAHLVFAKIRSEFSPEGEIPCWPDLEISDELAMGEGGVKFPYLQERRKIIKGRPPLRSIMPPSSKMAKIPLVLKLSRLIQQRLGIFSGSRRLAIGPSPTAPYVAKSAPIYQCALGMFPPLAKKSENFPAAWCLSDRKCADLPWEPDIVFPHERGWEFPRLYTLFLAEIPPFAYGGLEVFPPSRTTAPSFLPE